MIKQRKQSFFMYRGIPYDIVEEFQDDEGNWFVKGVSDDGEEATEELWLTNKKQKIGVHGSHNQNSI